MAIRNELLHSNTWAHLPSSPLKWPDKLIRLFDESGTVLGDTRFRRERRVRRARRYITATALDTMSLKPGDYVLIALFNVS